MSVLPKFQILTCFFPHFAQNGLKLTESQVNNVFKRKRDKRRPLTAEMYIALKEAMKDPKRNRNFS